jgi:hypothetical protein
MLRVVHKLDDYLLFLYYKGGTLNPPILVTKWMGGGSGRQSNHQDITRLYIGT